MAVDDTQVELRGMCPRDIADVLDALSIAKRIPRNELVVRVLREWCADRVHEANIVNRVTQGKPLLPDSAGRDFQ